MELFGIGRRYRELHRLTQVVQVLAKHGFGHVLEKMHLPMPARWRRKALGDEPMKTSRAIAQRAASALQDLGPTFVKLGQFLSTRPDLVPPVYIEEFSRLQDQVEPFGGQVARRLVESELGGGVETFFAEFADEPIASGSIAQVHTAETVEGRAVVVKIQRPGIERIIESDLELLQTFAQQLEDYVPEAQFLRPVMLVDELGRHLKRELDFLHEGAATQRFHKAFVESDGYHGPAVFWDLSTPSVLTLERIEGKRISDFIAEADEDTRKDLASRLFGLYMKQFFDLGHFQADPHPGNILVDAAGRINIIDFGLTGRVTDELQNYLGTAILALKSNDVDLLTAILDDLGVLTDETDAAEVKGDIANMLETYLGMPIGRMKIGNIFSQINTIAQRNALFLPRDFVLLGKALVTASGLAVALDPDFDAATALTPYMRTMVRKKFSPITMGKSAAWMGFHSASFLKNAPANLRRIIRKVINGELSINFQHKGLEKLIVDLDRASNRLAFSVVVASLIIASSLIINSGIGPLLYGVSALGVVGYLLAAVLGFWLIIAILRSGRM